MPKDANARTRLESAVQSSLLVGEKIDRFWIGITDLVQDGKWVYKWTPNYEPKWYPNEPRDKRWPDSRVFTSINKLPFLKIHKFFNKHQNTIIISAKCVKYEEKIINSLFMRSMFCK